MCVRTGIQLTVHWQWVSSRHIYRKVTPTDLNFIRDLAEKQQKEVQKQKLLYHLRVCGAWIQTRDDGVLKWVTCGRIQLNSGCGYKD